MYTRIRFKMFDDKIFYYKYINIINSFYKQQTVPLLRNSHRHNDIQLLKPYLFNKPFCPG